MKNIIKRAAALLICAACVLSFASCTGGNLDKDKDGIIGEEGKNGTDNIIGDGGVDDKANGGTTAAPDLGDMTNDDMTDNNNNNGGGNDNGSTGGSDNGGVLDPDDDVNGGMTNGGGNSVDPKLGIDTDGTQPSGSD